MNESNMLDQWLAGKKRLSPEEVKALPEGSKVWIHKIYGRRGEHVLIQTTVTLVANLKYLMYRDDMGIAHYEHIRRMKRTAYTLD